MDEEDTPLLGGDDHQETKTDFGSVDLKKMVYFHGKVGSSIADRRKESFL